MSDKIKNLKSYFNNGDVPTEAQFHELIDSFMLKSNDKLIKAVKTESNGDVVLTLSDASTITIPKHKVPTSKPISFITGLQAALDAKSAKNGDNTQNFKVKDAAANDDAVSKQQLDTGLATKAAKNGDNTQTFKVKNAVNADEAISKQQFDAVFNRLIPAPYIYKLQTTENKIYQQPSTKTVVNIFGSYFTPTSTVTVTGLTVSDFKFISDNQLQVSITATAATGSFDVIVNNGASTTKAKAWIISPGEVTVPKASDFSIVSGQADISQDGIIKVKQAGITGVVKFFNIPSSENFQLEFKASKSPLYTFPLSTISDKLNSVKLYIGGVEKLWFYYVIQSSGYSVVEVRHNNGGPTGWAGSANFEHLNLIKFEKKDGKLNFYVNNTIRASFNETTAGNVEVRAQVQSLDYIDIKKYKL